MMQTSRPMPRLSFGTGAQGPRTLPEEVAVALTFNGTTQAVMMATPDDLIDFAYGFVKGCGLMITLSNPGAAAFIPSIDL